MTTKSTPTAAPAQLDNASRVAKASASPAFTRGEYEDAILEIAKSEARAGESVASSLSRLCTEGDERVSDLYTAACPAEVTAEVQTEPIGKSTTGGEPDVGFAEHVYKLMMSTAELRRPPRRVGREEPSTSERTRRSLGSPC